MSRPWVLVLEEPSSNAERRVAGLPIVLRLALDAQLGGASAIVLCASTQPLRRALRDHRLRIPVLEEAPPGALLVRARASAVVPRHWFKRLAGQYERSTATRLDLEDARPAPGSPYDFSPIDVEDEASARRAERALFRSLRKVQDGWTSRWFNRYVSLTLSRLLVRTPLAPNQLTIVILAIGITGAVFAARGDYWGGVIGALLFHTQSVLDGCDGEMSRVTYQGSLLGEWLDTISDDVTNYSFFAAASWGLWTTSGWWPYLLAGIVTVCSGVIVSALEYRYLFRIGSGDLLKYPLSAGEGTGVFAAIQPLFKRDTFVLLTLIAALVGWLGPMLLVFSLGAIGILLGVVKTELRLARERRAGKGATA